MLSSGSSYALAVRNRYAQHFKNIRILNLHDTSTHCGLAGTFFCESCSSLNLWRTCAHTGCRGLGPEPHKSNVMDASQVNVLDIAAAAYVNGLVGGDEVLARPGRITPTREPAQGHSLLHPPPPIPPPPAPPGAPDRVRRAAAARCVRPRLGAEPADAMPGLGAGRAALPAGGTDRGHSRPELDTARASPRRGAITRYHCHSASGLTR